MKTYIITRGYVPRMRTHKLLKNYAFIVHSVEQRDSILESLPCASVIVTGIPDGEFETQRNWILQNCAIEGEWLVCMDDNIQGFEIVHPDYYDEASLSVHDDITIDWRSIFKHPCGDIEFHIDQLIEKCEARGTVYGGFSGIENHFFRQRKYCYLSFVPGRCFVIKRTSSLFKRRWAEDTHMSVLTVAKYGGIVLNRWIYPRKKLYEAGGIGSVNFREPTRLIQFQEMTEEFPGLIDLVHKDICGIRYCMRSEKRLTEWRKANGYC